jgi:ribosomal protein L12E/L44/L45/RPP1/RPP2
MYEGPSLTDGVASDAPPHKANNRGAVPEEAEEEEAEEEEEEAKEDRVSHACTTFVTKIPGRWRLGSPR